MIKVVIADDEERICRLIQALVDWEAMDMQVVGTAANGIEALEVLKAEKPDILITDIRMPGCNGLELIEKAVRLQENLQTVIISGYANFEYAQTALRYGVSEYLLKPINKKDLEDTLKRLQELILERKQEQQHTEQLIKNRENDIHLLREVMVQDLLEEKSQSMTEEKMRNQYHFDIQSGCYQAFCMKPDYDAGTVEEQDIQAMEEKARQVFDCGMARHCHEWVIVPKKGCIYGIMNFAPKQQDDIRKMLRDCLNQMQVQKNRFGSFEFSLGLGMVVKSPGELRKSLLESNMAVQERLLEGTGKLLELKDNNPALFEQKLLDRYSRAIDHALEVLSVEEMDMVTEDIYQIIMDTNNVHGWEILEFIQSAGDMFAMRLETQWKEALEQFKIKSENCYEVRQLFEALQQFQKQVIQGLLDMREEDSLRPVRIAKQYIQNHYNEQITLEEVSEKVGLSTAYFSVLFKKETEVGFAKYLMNVRMEQAKVLLRETGYSVADICKKVGYNDNKHFTHTFEKVVGVKPATYRKLYG